ncbi:MAG: hypothetical protein JWQ79_3327, partial [Mucilaginibacter sp.]|nr:hypothetical protein [Mucilaginibacter sp.]
MKTIKLMIAICIMASFFQKTMAESRSTGLYLTSDDYVNHKLSFATDGS